MPDPRKLLPSGEHLPTDALFNVIQVLEPGPSVTIAVGVSSANVALPTDTGIVRVANTADMYLAFGTGSITVDGTDDMLVPSGAEVIIVPGTATHAAVISADGSTTGLCSFTYMQGVV